MVSQGYSLDLISSVITNQAQHPISPTTMTRTRGSPPNPKFAVSGNFERSGFELTAICVRPPPLDEGNEGNVCDDQKCSGMSGLT